MQDAGARLKWPAPEPAFRTRRETAMPKLVTISQFPDPDRAYVALAQARRGMTGDEAASFDARLVLVLANHIGDLDVLKEAIALAQEAS
jgi:hypothetical protein